MHDDGSSGMDDGSAAGSAPDSPCGDCLPARRAFLLSAAAAAAGLLGLAVAPSFARAMPVAWTRDGHWPADPQERRYAIPAGDSVSIDEESSLILARSAGAVYAFSLACPHKRTALGWQPRNGRFECPKHKSKFQPDGVFMSGKATRHMDRYAIRRDGAHVVVDLAKLFRADRDAAAWSSAMVRV